LDRKPRYPRKVEMDIVTRQPQLLEVSPRCLGGDPAVSQGRNGCPLGPLGQLLPVGAEDQSVVDILWRHRPERLVQRTMQRFVRTVVVSANHMGDAEVDVVDYRCQLVGRRPVLAEEGDTVEPRDAEPGDRLAMTLPALRLPNRPFVPTHVQPPEVGDDRFLASRAVAGL